MTKTKKTVLISGLLILALLVLYIAGTPLRYAFESESHAVKRLQTFYRDFIDQDTTLTRQAEQVGFYDKLVHETTRDSFEYYHARFRELNRAELAHRDSLKDNLSKE